jgi:hypothetical protein
MTVTAGLASAAPGQAPEATRPALESLMKSVLARLR